MKRIWKEVLAIAATVGPGILAVFIDWFMRQRDDTRDGKEGD